MSSFRGGERRSPASGLGLQLQIAGYNHQGYCRRRRINLAGIDSCFPIGHHNCRRCSPRSRQRRKSHFRPGHISDKHSH